MKKKFVETVIEIVYFDDCVILEKSDPFTGIEGEDDGWKD